MYKGTYRAPEKNFTPTGGKGGNWRGNVGERSIAKWRWARMHGLEARGTELRASAKNKGGPGSGGREEGEENPDPL